MVMVSSAPIKKSLDDHVATMIANWNSGVMGGRGRAAEEVPVDDVEEEKPKSKKVKAEPPVQLPTLVPSKVLYSY